MGIAFDGNFFRNRFKLFVGVGKFASDVQELILDRGINALLFGFTFFLATPFPFWLARGRFVKPKIKGKELVKFLTGQILLKPNEVVGVAVVSIAGK